MRRHLRPTETKINNAVDNISLEENDPVDLNAEETANTENVMICYKEESFAAYLQNYQTQ